MRQYNDGVPLTRPMYQNQSEGEGALGMRPQPVIYITITFNVPLVGSTSTFVRYCIYRTGASMDLTDDLPPISDGNTTQDSHQEGHSPAVAAILGVSEPQPSE
jgi:hypothetical protein